MNDELGETWYPEVAQGSAKRTF